MKVAILTRNVRKRTPQASLDKYKNQPCMLIQFPPLYFFEIFSGSCILSRTFAQRGFQAIAFDHIQAPQYKVFHLDLCNVKDQTLLCTLIRKLRPSMIWLAPPCGTASKAKDIPAFDHQGNPISLPLRSSDFPDGLPDLPPHQHSRVLAANTLYTLVAKIISFVKTYAFPGSWKIQAIRTCGLHQPFDHFQLFHQSPCITACTGGPVRSLPNYSFMVLIFLRYTSCAIILISTYHGR